MKNLLKTLIIIFVFMITISCEIVDEQKTNKNQAMTTQIELSRASGTSYVDINPSDAASDGYITKADYNFDNVTLPAGIYLFSINVSGNMSVGNCEGYIITSSGYRFPGGYIQLNNKTTIGYYLFTHQSWISPGKTKTLELKISNILGQTVYVKNIIFRVVGTPTPVPICNSYTYSMGFSDGILTFQTGQQYYDNPYDCKNYYNGFWAGFNSQIPHY